MCFQCRVHAVMSAKRFAAYHRIRMSGFGRQLRFESFRMHAGLAEVVPPDGIRSRQRDADISERISAACACSIRGVRVS